MNVADLAHYALLASQGVILCYFLALNANYALLLVLGWQEISRYVRRRSVRDYRTIEESDYSLPVSILVPAYNEAPAVVEAVRSLLACRYPVFEVVVVNDGSTDQTLENLVRAFQLKPVKRIAKAKLSTQRVNAFYRSAVEDRLVVVDKDNGGKSDALNAGLNYARYPLFCAVDSDTMLERHALPRLVREFQVAPETVACGGIVRIVNGSAVSDASVSDVKSPRSLLANLQIVEYLRAFLMGRTGWSRMGALLIISGAFGLFRREVVIEAGGYDTTTVGEDAELVVRLHRHCRDQKVAYRVAFLADPVCWTEAPASMRVLANQRNRWQRGLVQTLWRHRRLVGRPRYGTVGVFAMPYFVVFEALGPLVEVIGYSVMLLSFALGWLSPSVALAFFVLAFSCGMAFSLGALWIEERAFQRYRRWSCLIRLVGAAVLENFGYRQWMSLVRAKALWTLWRGRAGWGEMTRAGFSPTPEPQTT